MNTHFDMSILHIGPISGTMVRKHVCVVPSHEQKKDILVKCTRSFINGCSDRREDINRFKFKKSLCLPTLCLKTPQLSQDSNLTYAAQMLSLH